MKVLRYSAIYCVSFFCVLLLLSSPSCLCPPPNVLVPNPYECSRDLNDNILESICLVNVDIGYGSGTLLEKQEQEDGTYLCRVLTAAHVILDGKDQICKNIQLSFFDEGEHPDVYLAVVESFSSELDVAVLKFIAVDLDAKVSKLLPADRRLDQADHVFTAGCGQVEVPYIADGRVIRYGPLLSNLYGLIIDSTDYLAVCGPTIYGNSGGAVFYRLGEEYFIVGVISKLHIAYGEPVYTLGYCVPADVTIGWLKTVGLSHLCGVEKS